MWLCAGLVRFLFFVKWHPDHFDRHFFFLVCLRWAVAILAWFDDRWTNPEWIGDSDG